MRPSANPRISHNDHASRSFQFFQTKTASYLKGVFESELWDQFILRAAQNNEAIWYAAIALGSAHEAVILKRLGVDTIQEYWTLQQYSRAMRCLTRSGAHGEQPSIDVMITASIMFMIFEVSLFTGS